ncbi:ATP binding [Desmophyllum pertusum]|uniref:ATP binding n=1 Tax=Desmophyllum pertusum TaxID=174260 RepID=A0A9W9Z2L6_9CNID|nr:ATP binding [Desmophyllum pertusum]
MGKESPIGWENRRKNRAKCARLSRSLKEITPDVTGTSTNQPGSRYVPEPPSSPPPEPSPSAVKSLYIALYDYDARTEEDLSFKKGRNSEVNIDDLANDWWRARSRETSGEGFIPSNYVALHQTLEAEDWYFGEMKRPEAEKLLKTPPNEHGAFLVRDSDKGGYALSDERW